jgi:hypothetical protein
MSSQTPSAYFANITYVYILILGVCILFRVWDQGGGFPSVQRYCSSFTIYSLICYMFRSYDHLQEKIYSSEITLLLVVEVRPKHLAAKWINSKTTVIALHRQKPFTLVHVHAYIVQGVSQ